MAGNTERHDPLVALADDPIGNTVHHPYSAFNQGWDAAEDGHPAERNPYGPGTRERHWWALGHADYGSDGGTTGVMLSPPPSQLLRPLQRKARP